MRIALQKFFIVIRLDHKRVHFTQALHHHFGCVTEIGNEPETTRARMKGEPNRIDRVVRHGKTLHDDIANRKIRSGAKYPPVTMSIQSAVAPNRFRGQRVAINRHGQFAAKNFQPANMIAVFVRQEDAIELFGCNTALLETQDELARA